MPDLDRRTVKPAHPDATIPDPDRRDRLPPEGREVVWSHYWEGHLVKGNVVPVEPAPSPDPAPQAPSRPAPAPKPAVAAAS